MLMVCDSLTLNGVPHPRPYPLGSQGGAEGARVQESWVPGPAQAGTLCISGEGLHSRASCPCSVLTAARAVNWGSLRARPRPGKGLSQATVETILEAQA